MKKQSLRTTVRLTACAFAGVFALQNPVQAFADSKPLYISDLVTVTADTPAQAKNILKNAGYRVLDKDVHEAAGGTKCVYIGYRTTETPEEAITDIKAMNTSGNFSYPSYEAMLKDQRESLERFSADIIGALKDYRENYRKGVLKGIIAHDCLNAYRDDDTGQLMGDLLLNEIREEMGADKYDALSAEEKCRHADMTTIVMQGNSYNTSAVLGFLAMAQDSGKDTWTARLKDAESVEEMREALKKEHPTLTRSQIEGLLDGDYSEDAKLLAAAITTAKEQIAAFRNSGYTEGEDADAYFEAHPEESLKDYTEGAALYAMLGSTAYDGGVLSDLFLGEEYDFEVNAEDRTELYPVLGTLTEGQRKLLGYTSLQQLLTYGNMSEEGWKETQKSLTGSVLEEGAEPVSMFEGVRRDVFDPNGVALTDSAQKLEGASGRSWMTEAQGVGLYGLAGAAIGSTVLFAASVACTAYLYKSLSARINKAVDETLKSAYHGVEVRGFEVRKYTYLNGAKSFNEAKNLMDRFEYALVTRNRKTVHFKDLSIESQIEVVKEWKSQLQVQGISDVEDKVVVAVKSPTESFGMEIGKEDIEFLEAVTNKQAELKKEAIKNNNFNSCSPVKSFLRYVGLALCVVFAVAAIASMVMLALSIFHKEHSDISTSPRVLVSTETDGSGVKQFIYYDAVKNGASLKGEPTQDDLNALPNGDLGAGEGVEWLVLYTTKDRKAGSPVLADSLKATEKTVALGSTVVSMFGKTSAQDVTEKWYGPNRSGKDGKTYLCFKQDLPATGAAISDGVLVASGIACTAIGALLGALISGAGKTSRQRRQAMTTPEVSSC